MPGPTRPRHGTRARRGAPHRLKTNANRSRGPRIEPIPVPEAPGIPVPPADPSRPPTPTAPMHPMDPRVSLGPVGDVDADPGADGTVPDPARAAPNPIPPNGAETTAQARGTDRAHRPPPLPGPARNPDPRRPRHANPRSATPDRLPLRRPRTAVPETMHAVRADADGRAIVDPVVTPTPAPMPAAPAGATAGVPAVANAGVVVGAAAGAAAAVAEAVSRASRSPRSPTPIPSNSTRRP